MTAFPQASLTQPGVEIIDENGDITEPWVDKIKSRVYAPNIHGAAVLGGEEPGGQPAARQLDVLPRHLLARRASSPKSDSTRPCASSRTWP